MQPLCDCHVLNCSLFATATKIFALRLRWRKAAFVLTWIEACLIHLQVLVGAWLPVEPCETHNGHGNILRLGGV